MSETVLDMSARMTRIPVPIASPGQCAICGKNEHPEGFAATDNFDMEFFGTIYFCADCVGDYARLFGFMSRAEIADLIEKQKRTDEELKVLRESVLNLESILDAYSRLRPNSGIPDYHSVSDVIASETADAGTDQTDDNQLQFRETIESVNDSSITESVTDGSGKVIESNESSDESGRSDVQHTTADVIQLFEDLGI